MENTVDLLQIKIEKARAELSEESRQAIDAIDWKNIIIRMRAEKGYSFTQIEDLELETELLLCGLLNPEDYPKELEKRMGIPKPKVDELVNELNEKIFGKIRAELVKNIERKKTSDFAPLIDKERGRGEVNEKRSNFESRDELLEKIENPEKTSSILSQKLSGTFSIPKVETDHSLNNMTKGSGEEKTTLPKVDPYREPTE